MRNCVINYADSTGWYKRGQRRLADSLKVVGFKGDVILFDENDGFPSHKDTPYGFKAYAYKAAQSAGYDNVLWMDSSAWAIKPIDFLFEDIISQEGYLFQNSGFFAGNFCSDAALATFKYDREAALLIPMYEGLFNGLNVKHPKVCKFLDEYFRRANDGVSFVGAWNNKNNCVSEDDRVRGHRHDMVIGSLIARQMNMAIHPIESFMAHKNWYESHQAKKHPRLDVRNVCVLAAGM